VPFPTASRCARGKIQQSNAVGSLLLLEMHFRVLACVVPEKWGRCLYEDGYSSRPDRSTIVRVKIPFLQLRSIAFRAETFQNFFSTVSLF
jgi:hypothetical protein